MPIIAVNRENIIRILIQRGFTLVADLPTHVMIKPVAQQTR